MNAHLDEETGPKYREKEPEPRLADGSPLHHAFIEEDQLVLKPSEVEAAKNMLAECIAVDPKAVEQAVGKSAEEARHILWGILGH